MNRKIFFNNQIEVLILAHREALKNAISKGFSLLGIGNVAGFEEQEKQRIYHEGAINALEFINSIKERI